MHVYRWTMLLCVDYRVSMCLKLQSYFIEEAMFRHQINIYICAGGAI